MKSTLLIFALLALVSSSMAQKTYIWQGGKPGRVNDWNCPANWSTYRVPDEFAHVFIPNNQSGTQNYPVIKAWGSEVSSLRVACGAKITIAERGSLTIHNPDYCEDVSRIVVHGKLILPGRPEIESESTLAVRWEH